MQALADGSVADVGQFGDTKPMPDYSEIDATLEACVASLGTRLFTEWAGAPARFFHTPGDPPFECFQIWVDAPEAGRVAVHARAVDTNDDTEDALTEDWEGPVAELDAMLSAAVATVEGWKARPRTAPAPPAPR